MNARTTWILLLAVLGVGSYIYFKERKTLDTDQAIAASRIVFEPLPDAIRRVEISGEDANVRCVLQEGAWYLQEPKGMRVNPSVMERLLNYFDKVRRSTLITPAEMKERGQTVAAFGLEDPRLRLKLGNDQRSFEYAIGSDVPVGDGVYVRRMDLPYVYTTSLSPVPLIPEDFNDFRDRRIFVHPPERMRRIELSRSTGFIQMNQEEEGTWHIQQPVKTRANPTTLTNLQNLIHTMRIERFVADGTLVGGEYGFNENSPYLRVFYDLETFPVKLILGRPLPDAAHLVYARLEGVDSVFAVSTGAEGLIKYELEALRDRRLMPEPLERIQRIAMEKDGRQLIFRRNAQQRWEMVAPKTWPVWEQRIAQLFQRWSESQISKFLDLPALRDSPEMRGELIYTARFQLSPAPGRGGGTPAGVPPASAEEGAPPGSDEWAFEVYRREVNEQEVIIHALNQDNWYSVVPGFLQYLTIDPLFYRDHGVLRIARREVLSISQKKGEAEVNVRRETPDAPWQAVDPKFQLHPARVNALLDLVGNLTALRLVSSDAGQLEDYGLASPALQIHFGLSGESAISRRLLLSAPNPKGEVFGMVLGQDVIFALDPDTVAVCSQPLASPLPEDLPVPPASGAAPAAPEPNPERSDVSAP